MRIPTFSQFRQNNQLLSKQLEEMNRLIRQASSNNKINLASEDPILASQIHSNKTFLENIDSYSNNGLLAQNRSKLFENSMQNIISSVNEVQILISKVQTGTMNDKDKNSIAEQLKGVLSNLLSYANASDADGNYIYSGFNSLVPPFVLDNNKYRYQGGVTPATIDISRYANTVYYESGFKVFADIFAGNGKFTIDALTTNTGSAATTAGSADSANYIADTYTLTFVTNSAGQLAYQVIGAKEGQVVPKPPATIPDDAPAYVAKSAIQFNGVNFVMDGEPKLNDQFTIKPATQENIFNHVQQLINALQDPNMNKGKFDQMVSQINASVNQVISHLNIYQTQIGTRSAAIDAQVKNNEGIKTNYLMSIASLQDINPAEVFTAINLKQMAIETTQASYKKLQEMLERILRF